MLELEYFMQFTCPCCGYPTLPARNVCEICTICGWEDDGQDDENAEEFMLGPNKGYSLAQARSYFEKYSSTEWKRDKEKEEPFKKSRIKLIKAFDRLLDAEENELKILYKELFETFQEYHRILYEEVKKLENTNNL